MKIWVNSIDFPKIDITSKDTSGREFYQPEMTVYYSYYKDRNHIFNGEFTCSTENQLDLEELKNRILRDLKSDPHFKP